MLKDLTAKVNRLKTEHKALSDESREVCFLLFLSEYPALLVAYSLLNLVLTANAREERTQERKGIVFGFRLPASHVHTVGPIYNSNSNSAASLSSAYRNSLRVAKDKNIQYIALPAISCGDEAATVVISVVREFRNEFKEIHFVLFLQDIYQVWVNKENDLMKN
ncbi:hypothetical protein Ahy_B03g064201 [Arachis hypogaea]|uniref:Macro domain-containing protein n=1 Tax=Arachis hypogaea TaxID=3818 RepID=A0A444ZYX0_ARAHY|nr:hypothetical protein Ahy_B03g064201 [Arachis hypogaea]